MNISTCGLNSIAISDPGRNSNETEVTTIKNQLWAQKNAKNTTNKTIFAANIVLSLPEMISDNISNACAHATGCRRYPKLPKYRVTRLGTIFGSFAFVL